MVCGLEHLQYFVDNKSLKIDKYFVLFLLNLAFYHRKHVIDRKIPKICGARTRNNPDG